MLKQRVPTAPPMTAVPIRTVLAGTVSCLAALGLVLGLRLPVPAAMALLMLATAVPMWWLEARRCAANGAVGPVVRVSRRRSLWVRRLRVIGGALVFCLLAASMRMQLELGGAQVGGLPELEIVINGACVLWLLAWARWPVRSRQPDSVAALGRLALKCVRRHRPAAAEWQGLLGWCVKVFFLPLMLTWLYSWLLQIDKELQQGQGAMAFFVGAMAALYALDTLFATIGYLSTHRGIDAQIRSTDATWLGWGAALVCYPPLNAVVLHQWLSYRDGKDWSAWFGDSWIAWPWAAAILILTGIYTSATLVFGPRFSNLTHRGIVTAGPFRWTKHPAYISKNLSWWLIAVPFLSEQGPLAAAANCAGLLGVNCIYWLRAKTEERHLMRDPVYREYAAWIEQHGWFAKVRRFLARWRPGRRAVGGA